MNFCQGELVVILKLNTMKTAKEMLEEVAEVTYIQGIEFSVIIFNDALAAMKKIALMAYDEGFKYAAEKFKIEPEGKQVLSVGQFIDRTFPQ
jgi:regulator of RNase E activity RraB